MTGGDIAGGHNLFVVRMSSTGAQLARLSFKDTTYAKVGSYSVKLNGSPIALSAISRVSISRTQMLFFFGSGTQIYKGSLPLTATSGTINLTKAFNMQVEGATVNGGTPDLTSYSHQGIHYDTAADGVHVFKGYVAS